MKRSSLVLLFTSSILIGCDEPIMISDAEKSEIASVTCSIIEETRGMDAAIRVEKVNDARKTIGEEPFLDGDREIKKSLWWGLCEELVLNDPGYEDEKQFRKEVHEAFEDFECPDQDDPQFFARDEIEDRKTRELVEMCANMAYSMPPPRT